MKKQLATIALGLSLSFMTAEAWALFGNNSNMEQRVARLEQMLNSNSQSDLVMQIERLQREIQQLHGEREIQAHTLDALKRRQQDLYSDLDSRISGGAAAQPGQPGTTPGLSIPPAERGVDPLTLSTPTMGHTPKPAAPSGPVQQTQTADPHQEAAYQAAYKHLMDGQYKKAIQSFKSFMSAYPTGPYADNAQYWLGEANYVNGNFTNSLSEFDKVVRMYPHSPKVPDSLLKMGFIQYEKKNWDQARSLLTKLVKKYPSATSAGLARKRLDRMRKEGH